MTAQPTVMTVLGAIPATDLGPTLPHEHLLADFTSYWQMPVEAGLRPLAEASVQMSLLGAIRRDPFVNRDNFLLTDTSLAIQEALEFSNLGGRTIVDVTLPDVGRDVVALQRISRATGLNIICGCGHYVHLAHPQSLDDEPVEAITERLVTELTDGVGSTGVRPGIIGEIGTWDPLHPREDKVLRAAARAQDKTAAALTVHLHVAARKGEEILAILDSEGADLTRVVLDHLDIVLGHLDIDPQDAIDYYIKLAKRGCFLEFDTCGAEWYVPGIEGGPAFWLPLDLMRARAIVSMVDAGFGEQLLLSHDVWNKINLVYYGGFGYGHILRTFVHNLRECGLGDQELNQIIVENPRRMLAGTV